MKKKKKPLIAAVVLLLAAFIIINNIYAAMRGQQVSGVTAAVGRIEDYYSEEGTLSFGQDYVVIAKAGGSVKEIRAAENAVVEKGDILFIIDDRDVQYEKALCESELAGLRAQLSQHQIDQVVTSSPQEYLTSAAREAETREAEYRSAKTVYDASAQLYSAGTISRLEWEQNKAGYESAYAAWQQAKERYTKSRELLDGLRENGIDESTINSRFYASTTEQLTARIRAQETRLGQLEDKLSDCVITADKAGIVTSVPVREMSMIREGTTAVVISSREKVRAEAEVLTSIAPYLQTGLPVTITLKLRGKDQIYAGQVGEVYDFAAKGTSALGLDEYRVRVKVDLENGEELAAMGGYDVTMRFRLYTGDQKLWIPASAVFRTDGQDYVFVIENGRAVRTAVEIEYQTSTQAVITEGLQDGSRVIRNADEEGIYDGAKVFES